MLVDELNSLGGAYIEKSRALYCHRPPIWFAGSAEETARMTLSARLSDVDLPRKSPGSLGAAGLDTASSFNRIKLGRCSECSSQY